MAALIGWAGTVLILSAYSYTARTSRVLPFHFANIVGAVLVGVSNFAVGAWPALVLNSAFGLIGLFGVIHHYTRRKS